MEKPYPNISTHTDHNKDSHFALQTRKRHTTPAALQMGSQRERDGKREDMRETEREREQKREREMERERT